MPYYDKAQIQRPADTYLEKRPSLVLLFTLIAWKHNCFNFLEPDILNFQNNYITNKEKQIANNTINTIKHKQKPTT